MILNLGLRTDVVQYYSEWFFRRLEEGFLYSRNPLFPNKVTKYLLSPDKVDAIVLCSKNYAPMLPRVHELCERYNTMFYYTITAYGTDVEPRVPSIDESIRTLKQLSKIVGRERLVWRFDPVLLTDKYTEQTLFDAFEHIAAEVTPYVSFCIFSFVEMFIRIRSYMPEIIPLTREEKRFLASGFGAIARKYNLPLQACGDGEDYSRFGVKRAACTTLEMLGKANGCLFRDVPHNGNKRGCHCITSRDVGWYDSCPNGCRYCNANHNGESVEENIKRHDPSSPLLIGTLGKDDQLLMGNQRDSLIVNDGRQLSLFDF